MPYAQPNPLFHPHKRGFISRWSDCVEVTSPGGGEYNEFRRQRVNGVELVDWLHQSKKRVGDSENTKGLRVIFTQYSTGLHQSICLPFSRSEFDAIIDSFRVSPQFNQTLGKDLAQVAKFCQPARSAKQDVTCKLFPGLAHWTYLA